MKKLIVFSVLVICSFYLAFADEVGEYHGTFSVNTGDTNIVITPNQPVCGNGIIEQGEQCDGSAMLVNSCSAALGSNYTGSLSCTNSCRFDFSACSLINNSNPTPSVSSGGNSGGSGGSGGSSASVVSNVTKQTLSQTNSVCSDTNGCNKTNETATDSSSNSSSLESAGITGASTGVFGSASFGIAVVAIILAGIGLFVLIIRKK